MHVLVVHAHPDPESFNRALCDTVVLGLEQGGHKVDVIDLYGEHFSPAMTPAERTAYHSDAPILDDGVRQSAELLATVDGLVFVYPTWWWGMPAVMKGWFERVMVPGVAFSLGAGRPSPGLTHLRFLAGVSTYGAGHREMLFFNDAGRRTIMRALRLLIAKRAKTMWLGLYDMDGATLADRRAFLTRVHQAMASL